MSVGKTFPATKNHTVTIIKIAFRFVFFFQNETPAGYKKRTFNAGCKLGTCYVVPFSTVYPFTTSRSTNCSVPSKSPYQRDTHNHSRKVHIPSSHHHRHQHHLERSTGCLSHYNSHPRLRERFQLCVALPPATTASQPQNGSTESLFLNQNREPITGA